MTVHSGNHEVTRSGQHCAFAHYSRHIRRNAVVINSQGGVSGIEHVCVANPNGSYAAVLTNATSSPQTVDIRFGGFATRVDLASDSVVTLNWKAA